VDGKPPNEADTSDGTDARTGAWYQTRALLATGVSAVLLVALLFVAAPQGMGVLSGRPLAAFLLPAVGVVRVLFGFAWMICIFRGPRDEPPPWRYRDR
jgi:hypothetical protein